MGGCDAYHKCSCCADNCYIQCCDFFACSTSCSTHIYCACSDYIYRACCRFSTHHYFHHSSEIAILHTTSSDRPRFLSSACGPARPYTAPSSPANNNAGTQNGRDSCPSTSTLYGTDSNYSQNTFLYTASCGSWSCQNTILYTTCSGDRDNVSQRACLSSWHGSACGNCSECRSNGHGAESEYASIWPISSSHSPGPFFSRHGERHGDANAARHGHAYLRSW